MTAVGRVARRVALGAAVALAVPVVGALGACTEGSEPCPPYTETLSSVVDVTDYDVSAVTVESDDYGRELVERFEPVPSEVSVDKLRLSLEADYTRRPLETSSAARRWTDLLVGAAHACSPALDTTPFTATSAASGITMTSDAAWDARFPPSAPLDQLVSIASDPVDVYSGGTGTAAYETLPQFLTRSTRAPLSARLRIDEPPAVTGAHRFSVTITLGDGRSWTQVLEPLVVAGGADG